MKPRGEAMQFKSVDRAINWAFRVCGVPILKGSSVFSLIPRSDPSPSTLSAHDKHAQAALILSLVDRLTDQNQKAWIVAHHCKVFGTKDWGSVIKLSDEQRAARDTAKAVEDQLVVAVIASMPTGIHSRRGFSKLVRNYFGAGIGTHAIRADLRCSHDAVPEWKDKVYTSLDRIANNIDAALEREMISHGLIEEFEESAITRTGYIKRATAMG